MRRRPHIRGCDPTAVVAAFVEGGGTYTDPSVTGQPLSGQALASYAHGLFEGFLDLHEILFQFLGDRDEVAQVHVHSRQLYQLV
jgi:hypothetical protein